MEANIRNSRALLVVALSVALAVPAASALDSEKVAREKYDHALKQVQSGDLKIDWQQFRLSAEVAGVAGDFDSHPVRDRVLQQLRDGDSHKALEGAQEIIAHNFANPEGHLLAMMAYQKMGQADDAAKERSLVDGVVRSILNSGDGKTGATAYFTVNVAEEYFFIGVVLGGSPKSQALVNKGGHAYDQMTIVGRDGKDQTLWFNTDTDIQEVAAAMGTGKAK